MRPRATSAVLVLVLVGCGSGGTEAGSGGAGGASASAAVSSSGSEGGGGAGGASGAGGAGGGSTGSHGAMHGAVSSSGGAPDAASSSGTGEPVAGEPVDLVDYDILPESLSVASGTVTLGARNLGKSTHNLVILDASGAELGRTPDLAPGEVFALTLELAPGTYSWLCDLPGHASLGMSGTLTAE